MKIRRSLLSIALAAGLVAPAAGALETVATAQPAAACPILGCSATLLGLLSGGSIMPWYNNTLRVEAPYIGIVLNTPGLVTGKAALIMYTSGFAQLYTHDTFGDSFSTGKVSRTANSITFSGGNANASFLRNGNTILGGHVKALEQAGGGGT
ncbi:MAG: hypothetical protein ACYDH6_11690 [Acidimicrobiales bacterium]